MGTPLSIARVYAHSVNNMTNHNSQAKQALRMVSTKWTIGIK